MTARARYVADLGLLLGAGLAFASGLVLLIAFHMGPGVFRPDALGLSRLAWQNLHRVGALLTLAGVLPHVVANRRAILVRTTRVMRGKPMRLDRRELLIYASNAVVLLTGFVAWLGLSSTVPLFGAPPVGRLTALHHRWIDVHHLAGMVALVLTTGHVRRRWPALGKLATKAGWPWAAPRPRALIAVDTKLCQACAECVHTCPRGVLGMVAFLWHRHAHVDHADACIACGKCLDACKHRALVPLRPVSPPKRPGTSAVSAAGSPTA